MRLLVSFLFVGLMATGLAQTPPPAAVDVISGTVFDSSGAAVPGATVELRTGPRVVQTTVTSARGEFRFAGVASGIYEIRATSAVIGAASITVAVSDMPGVPVRLFLAPSAAEAATDANRSANITMTGMGQTAAGAPMAPPMQRATASVAPASPVPTVGRGMVAGYGSPAERFNTESYSKIDENGFHRVADDPLSTFSIDVDTASYANVRRFLNEGRLPPADAVRIEELVNYFRFDYDTPTGGHPFAVTTEVGPSPWAPTHRLVLIGLKARPLDSDRTPPRNLVFLLDVSGSMNSSDKLPLVKTALRMLTATLTPEDRVAIVVYAGASGVALHSTSGRDKTRIDAAIADLRAGGSTNGAAGIRLAYDLAAKSFIKGGINRVILATDGDFNVGVTSEGELMRLIEDERKRGVFLSVLGVGTGNLKDSTMKQLADRGNGNYSYLDSLHEARRVLIAEAGATLTTVAKDVKIQVEFNPARVGAYRLVGYENRILAHRDFNDDTKDAGEIGAGHTVTALYEIVPPGEDVNVSGVDALKYQRAPEVARSGGSDELLTVKLRYKEPDGDTSQLMSTVVRDSDDGLSPNIGFAAAVAEFGMLLRQSEHRGAATWHNARELARRYRGADADGYRAEFVRLVDLAAALDAQQSQSHRRD